MKFSLETLKLLKNFTSVANVLFLNNEKGLVIHAPTGSYVAIAETPENLDKGDCVFYDWSKFLATIQAFGNEEAELDFKEKYVEIKNNSGGKIKYFYTNPRVIAEEYKKPADFSKYQKEWDTCAKVEVPEHIWNECKKIASIIGLDKLTINVTKDRAFLRLSESEGVNNSDHEQELETFEGEGEISVNLSMLNLIQGDYEISIKKDKAIKIANKDIPVTYFMGRMKGNTN